jgi:type I restriction enzyme S subunit
MTNQRKQVKFSEIITLHKGKPPEILPYYGADAEQYLTPEFLRGRSFSELAKPSSNAVFVDDGDTILLWDGSNAGECFQGRKGLLASTMVVVRHNEEFEKKYFFYSVKFWESYLKGQTTGSGIPHIDKNVFGNLEIFLFEIENQKKIATVLSTVDRAIAQTEALIAKQQRIKTGLMQDLLTKGIDENGNIRSEATHRFKDSPLGRIPEEWEVDMVVNFASQEPNSTAIGPFGSNLLASDYRDEDVPVVFVRDIVSKAFVWLSNVFVSELKASELKSHRVNPGDVIATKMGLPPCIAAVYPKDMPSGVITADVIKLTPDADLALAEWIAMFLNSEAVRSQVREITGGVTRPKITFKDFRSLLLALPKIEEQKQTLLLIQEVGKEIETQLAYLRKQHSTKIGLMQDLLTGKVPITPLLEPPPVGQT